MLTNHKVIDKYADSMDAKQLLDLITTYISVPLPPIVDQDTFEELARVAINEDKREKLWRLASNYYRKNIDFSVIEDYFIEKKDSYYLTELMSVVLDDIDFKKLIKKILEVNDENFIKDCYKRIKELNLISDDDLKKYGFDIEKYNN